MKSVCFFHSRSKLAGTWIREAQNSRIMLSNAAKEKESGRQRKERRDRQEVEERREGNKKRKAEDGEDLMRDDV